MSTVSLAGDPPAGARWTMQDMLVFGLGVGALLIFSQGWVAFLTGNQTVEADSGIIRNMFLPAYAIGILYLALSPWDTMKALLRQPFLIALMGVVVASLLWSIAPDQTARRIFAVGCTTLAGVVLAVRFRWAALAEVMAAASLVLIVLSVVTAVLLPRVGVMSEIFPGAWRGLWPEKNALGGNMAMSFVVAGAAAFLNPKRAWLWFGVAGGALFLVLMSTSKTSLVSLMLGAGALGFIFMVRRGPAMGVATTWTALLGVLLLGSFILFASDVFFEILGKDATLTGRTKIWAGVMNRIAVRPWDGYGYGAVWTDTGSWGPVAWITRIAGFRAQHAHNSWLEQWLGLGIFGLAAFALFFAQTVLTAIVSVYRSKGAYLALPYLVVYALMSLTESIAVVYNDLRWVTFVALAVKLAWPDRPDPQAPMRRAPSATVTMSNPRATAASANRPRTA